MESLFSIGRKAKIASSELANYSTDKKNNVLKCMAVTLLDEIDFILYENSRDLESAKNEGKEKAFLDRLMLDEKRINEIAEGLLEVAKLPDPIGKIESRIKRPNGLWIEKKTVPLGVIGIIYEARPNVTVDESAKIEMAKKIVINAKTSRVSVCNAAETLLIADSIAPKYLPVILSGLEELGVKIRGCKKVIKLFPKYMLATEEDWYTEYLDYIISVKIVNDIDEAIEHINKYGTKHSEAIITEDQQNARKFSQEIDAAAVYINASTRFTDGFEFGLGAEIGISTQKLHARGPMGLEELTSYKYVVYGDGQIR